MFIRHEDKVETEYGSRSNGGNAKLLKFEFFSNELGDDFKRRLIFLDGEVGYYGLWHHEHFSNTTKARVAEMCLIKNKDAQGRPLADRCPACEHSYVDKDGKEKHWHPAFCGCFSVIDLGLIKRQKRNDGTIGNVIVPVKWTNRKGEIKEFSFQKKCLMLKHGNEKYPGMLQKLSRSICNLFVTEIPNFKGVIADVKREGRLSEKAGDIWQVEPKRLREDQLLPYLHKAGAPDDLDVEVLKPYDFDQIFVPKTVNELQRIVDAATAKRTVSGSDYGMGYDQPSTTQEWRNEAAEYDGQPQEPYDDSDLPF